MNQCRIQEKKEVYFNLNATAEMIMDVQKYPSKQADKTTMVEEFLNKKCASTKAHIRRRALEELKHEQTISSKQVAKGLSKVTKSVSNMLTKMTVCGKNNLE